jgi:hypothetical protein
MTITDRRLRQRPQRAIPAQKLVVKLQRITIDPTQINIDNLTSPTNKNDATILHGSRLDPYQPKN